MLLERMVIWCLEKHGFLTTHHSTTDQLVYLENTDESLYLEDKHMIAVFFDLEKAFDKVEI